MAMYQVRWEIDVEADDPQEAARKALTIQRDPTSIATVFDVVDQEGHFDRVDLIPDEPESVPYDPHGGQKHRYYDEN